LDAGLKFEGTGWSINPFRYCVQHYGNILSEHYIAKPTTWLSRYTSEDCIEMMDILLEYGFDLHQNMDEAFRLCVDCTLVEYFMTHGANVHVNNDECLLRVVDNYSGYLDVIRLLLKHGADPNGWNRGILKAAAGRFNIDAMIILLEAGADPCGNGDEIIQSLGSNLKIYSYYSFDEDQCLKLIKILREKGCNLIKYGQTLFRIALHCRQLVIIEYMLELGFDPKRLISENDATSSETYQTITRLLESGVTLEAAVRLLEL